MRTVEEVLALVLNHAEPMTPVITPLATPALGLVLAEAIAADIDSPPFDKALVDGYAVRSADLQAPPCTLRLIGEVLAGATSAPPQVEAGTACRITTGAPLPPGADAVLMREVAACEAGQVYYAGSPVPAGQHVLACGSEFRAGQVVLEAGTVLRPVEFGLLAAVGKTAVRAYPAPPVAVIVTGDELVEPMRKPRPGQIRNSNGPMLMAQAARVGGLPRFLGIGRDQREHLLSLIKEGLEVARVVVLSGGVSMGQADLVPGVLAELGVERLVHGVNLKPGKPLYVGRRGDRLVFGLPGNPVSSLVCFELFIRPAIAQLRGVRSAAWQPASLPLAAAWSISTDRDTFHPARLHRTSQGASVEPLPWLGSPDLLTLSRADALVRVPPGAHTFPAGATLPVLTLFGDFGA